MIKYWIILNFLKICKYYLFRKNFQFDRWIGENKYMQKKLLNNNKYNKLKITLNSPPPRPHTHTNNEVLTFFFEKMPSLYLPEFFLSLFWKIRFYYVFGPLVCNISDFDLCNFNHLINQVFIPFKSMKFFFLENKSMKFGPSDYFSPITNGG